MDLAIFEKFRSIIYRESGIVLAPEKLPLLSSRIQKRLNALGLKSESEYLRIIELDINGEELINLIDVVSTNVTHFYRESEHFTKLREILTERISLDRSPVKIWCAAASSGEEPYTLAFESEEALKPAHIQYRLLATDICTKVLSQAIRGVYPENALEKVPPSIRTKYFRKIGGTQPPQWQVTDDISGHILFKKLNLVSFPYPLRGDFDVIFCRNVMIYFDTQTRGRVVNEFWKLIKPGGYLFVSHSENLIGIDHKFTKVSGSVFRRT